MGRRHNAKAAWAKSRTRIRYGNGRYFSAAAFLQVGAACLSRASTTQYGVIFSLCILLRLPQRSVPLETGWQ